jgi:hypothetical protein
MIKNLLNRLPKCLLERMSITTMLDEEIDLLRRERIRGLSKIVRAQAEVDYYDKLLEKLSAERVAAQRLEFPPLMPDFKPVYEQPKSVLL